MPRSRNQSRADGAGKVLSIRMGQHVPTNKALGCGRIFIPHDLIAQPGQPLDPQDVLDQFHRIGRLPFRPVDKTIRRHRNQALSIALVGNPHRRRCFCRIHSHAVSTLCCHSAISPTPTQTAASEAGRRSPATARHSTGIQQSIGTDRPGAGAPSTRSDDPESAHTNDRPAPDDSVEKEADEKLMGSNPQGSIPSQPGGKRERGNPPFHKNDNPRIATRRRPPQPPPLRHPPPPQPRRELRFRREAPGGPEPGRSPHRSNDPESPRSHQAPRFRSTCPCAVRDSNL